MQSRPWRRELARERAFPNGVRGPVLLNKLTGEFQRGPDVFGAKIVFTLNIIERHIARKTADDDCHGHARPTDDGFSMADRRVDNDAVGCGHGAVNGSRFNVPGEVTQVALVSFVDLMGASGLRAGQRGSLRSWRLR